ncbi:MAG: DNA phosphorothioation-associated putative methyltransferase, partial [Gammaproteobacteria bacterium]|nr:DNA phosphorothioation-associated putative methyltransferase [Gammaproteobacteria bacterium]
MDFGEFQNLVKTVKLGKHLPEAIYIHQTAIELLPEELREFVLDTTKASKIRINQWNLLKLHKRDYKFSLLNYPTFLDEPYPSLHHSHTFDLTKATVRTASYKSSENPPVLHRRETFVAPGHPQVDFFKSFTKEGEAIGLYENTRIIGFKQSWERLIKRKGYYLDNDYRLRALEQRLASVEGYSPADDIQRHKTAISRGALSVPLFLIAKRGYLSGDYTVLDYGCGKGDDLNELEEHGIDCIGWDPSHRPDTEIEERDIVNLGFVINVIEDRKERIETLKRAFSYAKKIMVVSAMLGNEDIYERFKPYGDGVITTKNTFQKYFRQSELQQFIESNLEDNAIALGPGVFAVFKDKLEEQRYLLERQRTRHQWRQLTTRPPKIIDKKRARDLFNRNKPLFEDFWYTCLDFGRLPASDEFEQHDQIRQIISSHNKAFGLCCEYFDITEFEKASQGRTDDLLVYFALGFFKRRDAYARMPQGLQRDIKAFFGKYTEARNLGKSLLFSIAETDLIYEACVRAHSLLPASQLNGQHDLIFHKKYLNECPRELRVYIGCAIQLYGDLDSIDLIKLHIGSGKVSLMAYDNWTKEVPLLKERIKIKLKEQDIDFFDYYGPYEPPPL